MVVPTIDTELLLLSQERSRFADAGIHLVISDASVVQMCRDKRRTNAFFAAQGIATPPLIDMERPTFPMFIKPYDGSSSIGIRLLHDPKELSDDLVGNPRNIFMAYLDPALHTEFTVDLYYDRGERLRCLVPRQRLEIRAGEISKGLTRRNGLVPYLRAHLPDQAGLRGCITLQAFVRNATDEIFGIEINPRFGGGYPLSYAAGANYPRWLIQEYLLGKTPEFSDTWEDNLLMLRYDNEVLVHGFAG